MNNFVIAIGSCVPPLHKLARETATAIGKITVADPGERSTIPIAPERIQQAAARGAIGKKHSIERPAHAQRTGQEQRVIFSMPSKTQSQAVTQVSEIEIGLADSAVVLVERGDAFGVLIAEGYTVGELPSEITMSKVIYLCAHDAEFRTATISRVLVSVRNEFWSAVDTAAVAIIPCPASQPYPILFISKHGYGWMAETIRNRDFTRLRDHLAERFDSAAFKTDRRILTAPGSPFSHAPCINAMLMHLKR